VGLKLRNLFEDIRMKKVLALVVAAAMGLSSAAFAAATHHHSGAGCCKPAPPLKLRLPQETPKSSR
jgi:opacity protein-like surface antigen